MTRFAWNPARYWRSWPPRFSVPEQIVFRSEGIVPMAEVLNVSPRDIAGKRNAKRLRAAGSIPAILYGHKESSVSLTLSTDEMASVLRHGGRVVELKGAVNEKALIRELQWDVYGTDVLHVDLTRVSEHERIQVMVQVDMRGQAPGLKNGGVVEQLVHEVEVDCEALSIPERLEINVNELNLGDSLTASSLHLPDNVKLLSDADAIIVHCVEPTAEEDLLPSDTGAEPEVIGRKPDEETEE